MNDTNDALPQFEHVILALQGGGALGAYQAGVYQGLSEAGCAPDWVVGVSIGSINAALIAGNPPERRVARLREFWERVGGNAPDLLGDASAAFEPALTRAHVANAMAFGIPGFFSPRFPPPFLAMPGSAGATSFYDTEPLNRTLAELADFDLINSRAVRLSLGAVNVRTSESVYFDNARMQIRPDHVRASGALPPGFPPVEIDGEYYWDGGIVSNSPLWYASDESAHQNVLIVQADVFNPRGELPETLDQAAERVKDVQYSSKQRLSWERIHEREDLRAALREVLTMVPQERRDDAAVRKLTDISDPHTVSWVRLVNDAPANALNFKDVDFSQRTVNELWDDGLRDVRHMVEQRTWKNAIQIAPGFHFFEATAHES